ncbi:retrovirus-related pol polyprotein from transposon TNT 1-94 [Tanacetum coccineum]
MARQCTKPKRPMNSSWFKEKMLLVQAQNFGQVFDEEQFAFLADPRVVDVQVTQTTIPLNFAFQTDDLDAYDPDYDDYPLPVKAGGFLRIIFLVTIQASSLSELNEVKTGFNQWKLLLNIVLVMHANSVPVNVLLANHKCLVDVHMCVNSLATLTNYAKMEQDYIDEYSENLVLKAELAKKEQMVEKVAPPNNATVIAPGMFKLDLEPLSPKELVEHAKALRPLDSDLDSACKYAKRIKEVLVYVTATCPSLTKPIKKLVMITPLNKNRKVRMKSSTSASRSQPSGNTKNNRISWKPTRWAFTIVGNTCPLTRFTSTKVEPLKENTSKSLTTPNPEIKIYRRKTKVEKSVVQIVLLYLDSECSKHMTGNHSQLINFVHKFLGIVRFGNDQIAKIMGYDLEVAFRKHTCYIHDLEGVDLLKGSRGSNLYTLSLEDMMLSSPICLLSKASKTKSWLWHRRKPDLSYLYVFGALCYPTNDSEDLGKLKTKAYIGIFIGYAPAKKAYQIYNKRTHLIIETIHIDFDELTLMFDKYFNPPPSVVSPVLVVVAPEPADPIGTPFLTSIDQDAPSPSTSQTSQESQSLDIPSSVEEQFQNIEVTHIDNDPFFGVPIPEPNFEECSLMDIIPTNMSTLVNQAGPDQDNPNHVYKLKKALYGLKQAPRAWYDLLSSFLLSQNFSKDTVNPTLFTQKEGKDILLVQIYVDDTIFASTGPSLCETFSEIMCSKFKMSMMGKMSSFIGLQISQSPRGIFLNQSKYALKIIKKYGMETSDPVDTPMVEKYKLDEDLQGNAVDPTRYREMIGSFMYLSSGRPDLVFIVCMYARYQAKPTEKHLYVVKRIFRYLKGTINMGHWYSKDSCIALTDFADADHASCQDTRKSTSGSM